MLSRLTPQIFWRELKRKGFTHFSGVPCSLLKEILNYLSSEPEIKYIPAVREDSALGMAAGWQVAGFNAGILIQNSGLGNLVNPLTSFELLYKIPILMVISWRGEPGKADAPEHSIVGKKMLPFLDELEIPYKIISPDFGKEVAWVKEMIEKTSLPVALILKEGVVGDEI